MKIKLLLFFIAILPLTRVSAQVKTPNTCTDKTKAEVMTSIVFYKQKLLKGSKVQLSTYKLGMCYYKLNMLDTSIYYFDKLIALNPKYPAAYSNRGLCKLLSKNKTGACQDFSLSIKNGEDHKIVNNKKLSEWLKTECSL
ncbi:MAG: tetratricopeptide repeat protein [Pyrinomonadaceae bacterium]|nr:tetratricopeptide repeat protein [Sphingobacteriaceae bacterium]